MTGDWVAVDITDDDGDDGIAATITDEDGRTWGHFFRGVAFAAIPALIFWVGIGALIWAVVQ